MRRFLNDHPYGGQPGKRGGCRLHWAHAFRFRPLVAHAPHLIDLEVLSALRRAVRRRKVAEERAAHVRGVMMDLRLVRHPHRAMAERIWDLRQNLTPYDASYVALSEALRLPLVTCDGRLARSKGHGAEIELYA